MVTMNSSDDKLIAKYLDGTATPEEFAVLEGRLRDNPATRLCLLQEAGFESQLRLLLNNAQELSPELTGDGDVEEIGLDESSPPPSGRTIYWKPAWLWIPVAAAAAALLAVLAIPLLSARHKAQPANTGVVKQNRPDNTRSVAHPIVEQKVAMVNEPVTPKPGDQAQPDMAAGNAVSKPEHPVIVQQEPASGDHLAARQPEPPTVIRHPTPAGKAEKPLPHGNSLHRNELYGKALAMTQPSNGQTANTTPDEPVTKPAAVAAAAVAARSDQDGRISSLSGDVYLTRMSAAGSARRKLMMETAFLAGDLIETGPSSSSLLRYEDGSMVRLYAKTRLTLSNNGKSRNLQLAAGAIDLRVQPQSQGSNLVVRTAYVEVRVVGTEFRVITDGSGSWVGVKDGRVEVVRTRANGEVVKLEPGYFTSAIRGFPPVSTKDTNWRGKCQVYTGSPTYP